MGIFRARSVVVAVMAVMMMAMSMTETMEPVVAVVPPAVMVMVAVVPAPIAVMVTAVAPAMTPVAAVPPADLRGNRLRGARRFHGSEPSRRRAGRSSHQPCQAQDGSDGANSPPGHFCSSPFYSATLT